MRIAVIEDTLEVQENLRTILAFADDMELVALYGSAEEATREVVATRPDVLIVDVNLPGASGIVFIGAQRATLPGAQFMVYTVHDDDARVFEALKAGANGYLLKSASPHEIINAIRELKRGGAPMSPSVARRVVEHIRPATTAIETGLSDREMEVLRLLADGLLYKEIAGRLAISSNTVKNHIHRIYEKLHVQTRTEAVNRFFGR